MKHIACAAMLLFFCLAPFYLAAREAGWVPIEKYGSPLLKGASPASHPPRQEMAPTPPGPPKMAREAKGTVYDGQPPITEKELLAFVDLLPAFRRWAHVQHEDAHPVVRQGQADFLYSSKAGDWVRGHGWDAPRFFCVMGKMAAALVIVEEGNDMRGTRPADMPTVDPKELALARKHLGSLLRVSYDAGSIR